MDKIKFILPEIKYPSNNSSDPYLYYRRPLVGWFYIHRIQYGLDLLEPYTPFKKILEVGYGSGLLIPTLSLISKEYYGIDIHREMDRCKKNMKSYPVSPWLFQGDIQHTGFEDGYFDLVVAFSIFEHLRDVSIALKESHRILKPHGKLLIGMPRVDKCMDRLFHLIGFHDINDLHFSTYKNLLEHANTYFKKSALSYFPFRGIPVGSLYFNMLLEKKS